MFSCSKKYYDFPFAHRAPQHDGHCRLIHGHNWSFEITFTAAQRDPNGFVMDFGKLKTLKSMFDGMFDHTLLLARTDPLCKDISDFVQAMGINNVRKVNDCSCEGVAELVYHIAAACVIEETKGRVQVSRVVVYEDRKNFATYEPDPQN